jgi:hypothetical protein
MHGVGVCVLLRDTFHAAVRQLNCFNNDNNDNNNVLHAREVRD